MYTKKRNKQKMATSICLLQTEDVNGELPYVSCKRKWKTENCFPWSANYTR